ncbi:hypothetical protein C8A03DRAFT_46730 [Achaetomium macrosporum]|uniref:Uncharacterized protein n=1 Tax=Achaetomium macrosporum TaxID=79813 RepID=A0AAN7C4V1_9PEZI|nr:hypothetical protein C8A03DRAFT_46730 [Achaetomium macrosporum]
MSGQTTASPVAERSTEEVVSRQLSVADLDGEHRELLIIDGLPIGDVAFHSRRYFHSGHPIDGAHEELCPGMLDKAREFCGQFQPEILKFNAQVLHEYRTCAPGSRRFKTRLIEMVAVAIHQIAAILFELDTSVHKDDGIADWAPPKDDARYWERHPNGPLPTLFHHPWYEDYDQYPRGVADMVGYWAENRILGGVVLFDRRDPGAEPGADPDTIYFHTDREHVTYRIYQLLPEQRNALLNFLTADAAPSTSPLPILGDENNRIRVDPEEPIQATGIYRDPLRTCWDKLEYPTHEDRSASYRRAKERQLRLLDGYESN